MKTFRIRFANPTNLYKWKVNCPGYFSRVSFHTQRAMKGLQILLLAVVGVVLVTSSPPRGVEGGLRLIKTSEHEPATWMNQDQIWELIVKHENFVDVTDHTFPAVNPDAVNVKAIPTTIRFASTVTPLTTRTNIPRMQQFIQTFSSYRNRYYESVTGTDSQRWLLTQVQAAVQGYEGTVTVSEVMHSWAQNSIVAKIPGSDPTLRSEVVIIGAHQDSINIAGATLAAPGADDNASGSVVVLETLRILVQAGYIPKRTIEFHWYAAEEVGLRGSAAIAQSYYNTGVNVVGMVNFDVPGYHMAGTDQIGIYTDNVNANVSTFLRLLVDQYCVYTWQNRVCGYGCSDHASWHNYNYPAGFPAEVRLHPQMHTVQDVIAQVGFEQVAEFVKLSLGFVVEMSEPY